LIDHYRTLAAPSEFRQKIDRSEFLGIAFPVETEDAFFAEFAALTKRHYDATHLCWAFRLFAIEGADLYDTAVIVVRWYGGVKLGTGGLSRAYRETAAESLRIASIDDRYVYQRFRITVPFDQLGVVYRLIDAPHVLLVAEHFGETNEFDFDVRLSRAEEFAKTLIEKRLTD